MWWKKTREDDGDVERGRGRGDFVFFHGLPNTQINTPYITGEGENS